MEINRKYNCKAVDMLMTAKTINKSFISYLKDLSVIRTDWNEIYANGLMAKIDEAIETQLGLDAKKSLREASASVNSIQKPAKNDLASFKVQVDVDFKKEPERKEEIFKTLGFTKNLREVQKSNNQAIIQLLYTFKTNMTDVLRIEITSKGMNPTLIDNIISYADTFKTANIVQENSKGTTKVITQDVVGSFNDIYDEVIGICKKASLFYKNDDLKKEQFTFNKVLTHVRTSHRNGEKPTVAVPKKQIEEIVAI